MSDLAENENVSCKYRLITLQLKHGWRGKPLENIKIESDSQFT